MKIGLFGGSFDPVHRAHTSLAEQALIQFKLDRVIWIPAASSPFKQASQPTTPEHRQAMVELVCEGCPQFEVSPYEIKKGGISYSAETLRYFQKVHTNAEFFWILGSDTFKNIIKWKEAEFLIQNLTFIVAQRGDSLTPIPEKVKAKQVQMKWNPVSSTEMKADLAQGKASGQLDPRVLDYIRQHRLYGVPA